MKKRIQYMYEKGDTEYMDIFLQVKDMSDLLYKSGILWKVSIHMTEDACKIPGAKQQVADYKDDLEEDKNEWK